MSVTITINHKDVFTFQKTDIEKVITLEKTHDGEIFGFHLLGGAPVYVITVASGN